MSRIETIPGLGGNDFEDIMARVRQRVEEAQKESPQPIEQAQTADEVPFTVTFDDISLPVSVPEATQAEEDKSVSPKAPEGKPAMPISLSSDNLLQAFNLSPGTSVGVDEATAKRLREWMAQQTQGQQPVSQNPSGIATPAPQTPSAYTPEVVASPADPEEFGDTTHNAPVGERTTQDNITLPDSGVEVASNRSKRVLGVVAAILGTAAVAVLAVNNATSSESEGSPQTASVLTPSDIATEELEQQESLETLPLAETITEVTDKESQSTSEPTAEPTEPTNLDPAELESLGLQIDCTAIVGTEVTIDSTSDVYLAYQPSENVIQPIKDPIIENDGRRQITTRYAGPISFNLCQKEATEEETLDAEKDGNPDKFELIKISREGIEVDLDNLTVEAFAKLNETGDSTVAPMIIDRISLASEGDIPWSPEEADRINKLFLPDTEDRQGPAILDPEIFGRHITETFAELDSFNQEQCLQNTEASIKQNIEQMLSAQIAETHPEFEVPITFSGKFKVTNPGEPSLTDFEKLTLHEVDPTAVTECTVSNTLK